ncbi:MAG: Gfo/Idh/MocA family protein [Planctomycetota bacterium]
MIDTCLVGVKGYGHTYFKVLTDAVERGEVRLVAAAILDQTRDKEECDELHAIGCRIYTDYREMFASHGREAVLACIPTGIHLHAPMTIAALRAGMNVLVEKPAAGAIQDVRAMQDAERESGLFVAVGYQTMYAAEALAMKRTILDGRLGPVRSIKCMGAGSRDSIYYTRNDWAGRLKVGGDWVLDSPFNNANAHQLNMMLFLAGSALEDAARPKSIQAELYRANDIEAPDTACMRIVTEAGVPIYFCVSHCPEGKGSPPEIVVTGEKGTMRWFFHDRLVIETEGREPETHRAEGAPESRASMLRAVIGKVTDPGTFACTLEVAGAHTLCVNGAHQSSPVRPIPPEHVRTEPSRGETRMVIAGLDEAMRRGAETEKLFSELGVRWATPAPVFSLEGYEEFTGPACPSTDAVPQDG